MENRFITSKIINFLHNRNKTCTVWYLDVLYPLSPLFYGGCCVYRIRHRWDKDDQNPVGSKAADGCSVGRS